MKSKFLSLMVIVALLLGVMFAIGPARPTVAASAAEAQAPSAQRDMLSRLQEFSAEEQAAFGSQTFDLTAMQPGKPIGALGQAADSQKAMFIIELQQAPLAVTFAKQTAAGRSVDAADLQTQLNALESAQAVVQTQLEALGVDVISNYTAAYNGFLASVPANQMNAIRGIPGVVGIHRAPTHVPSLSSSVPLIGAPEVWNDLGFDGTDVVVAIIDTGIDYTHAVFGGSGDAADYANNNPDIVESGSFPTAKVIGGWDFAGTTYNADPNADSYQPIPHPDGDPLDEAGHGTHVASITAGNAAGQVSDGVAPGAKLIALKVFGAEGSTNLVMNALDWATFSYLRHGYPQVINMSLGSSYGPGDDLDSPDIIGTNNATEAGIVVVASAGNSSNVNYITGSPGSASKAISVSASTTGWVTGPTVSVVGSDDPALNGIIYMPSAFPPNGHYSSAVTAKLAYAGAYSSATLCAGSTATPANAFHGKVVLIERGICGFAEKSRTAKGLGAAGVLIFNNAAGGNAYVTMAFDDLTDDIAPSGFLARDDGLALVNANGQTVTVSAESDAITVVDKYTPADSVASFSSRGPRGTDSRLKPEIGAPGYNIFAASMGSGDEGVGMSGTSMAAPHIAGVAALMVQAHPDWTFEQIKAAMMNTAVDFADDSPIPRVGAGRVDAFRAASTPVYVVGDADLVSVSGYFASDEDEYTVERDITFYNTDRVAHAYTLGWDYQGDSMEGVTVGFSSDEVVVEPSGSATVHVTFTFDMTELPNSVGDLEEIYGNLVFTPRPLYRMYFAMVGGSSPARASAAPAEVNDALRLPFYFVPRAYNTLDIEAETAIKDVDEESATFAITQSGPTDSDLWLFPLLVSDPKETGTPGDVRAVSVDFAGSHPTYGPILAFAVNAWAPWHLPHYYFAEFDVYIDNNEDGVPDYAIYNAPVSGQNLFVATVVNLKTGTSTSAPFAIYTDFNSGYMEMYVLASQLGLSGANADFDFQVIGFDYWGNMDDTAPGSFDLLHLPFGWDADSTTPGPEAPEANFEAWVNDIDGYANSQPEGVMIVDYTGNPANGGEAYLFDVDVSLPFDLTVLHTDDFHARVDEFDVGGAACSPTTPERCIGGSARLKTLVDSARANAENSILVDAGDQFQGTLYFNLFKSEVLALMMNTIGYDAMTIGNHEFDDGPVELGIFARSLNFPIVSTNLDVSAEPSLAGRIPEYTILNVGGEQIGILGATTEDVHDISSPGPNVEVKDTVEALQAGVDFLADKGIDKVVLLSHMGYGVDQEVAAAVSGIDVIVGGHTHSFLYDPADPVVLTPPNMSLIPAGPYPTIVESPAGEPVLIVAALEWGKLLGELNVTFNGHGIITAHSGNPIYSGNNVAKDPEIEEMLAPYREAVTELMTRKVGEITVDAPINVDGQLICRLGECLMGNLVTDAMLWQVNTVGGGNYQIAVTNGGGLRAALAAGDVTYGGVMTVLPFGNTLATMDLKGEYLRAALEHSARLLPAANGGFLQTSGMRYTIDTTKDPGSRITDVEVWDGSAYVPLDDEATYKIVTNNFTRNGGDGFSWFRDDSTNAYDFGPGLELVVIDYFKEFSPVTPTLQGRINILP